MEQLLFAARNYEAMGNKLKARGQFLDSHIPRGDVANEFSGLATQYRALKSDFEKLWLADCKAAGSFEGYKQRFDQTTLPCEKKAAELRQPSQ